MKQEVRRGRKFVEYHDPDTQDEHTFTQEISGADVSYQDEQGRWQQLVEDWETDGQDGFSFRASRMNHKVRFDSIGAWRWYPRRNVETEYIVINRPQCWLTATKRWGNLLVNGISREGRDITLTSVRKVTRVIHSRWNGIKTDWILLDSTAPTKFRQQVDLVGLTELDGWLYGADGEKVARLTPTTAIDAEGNELPTSTSYENGILEFSADVTGAAFPVVIDPDYAGDTGDGYIRSAGYADWETAQATSSSFVNSSTIGVICGAHTAYIGEIVYYPYRGFIKFDTSAIPDTDTVTQVNLKLTPTLIYNNNPFDTIIVKQDWSSLDLTNATDRETAWDGCLSGTIDATFANSGNLTQYTQATSPNLTNSWVSKTGFTCYSLLSSYETTDTPPVRAAGNTTQYHYVRFAGADHATESYRPVLSVTYTTASGALLKVNMNAQMQNLTGGLN